MSNAAIAEATEFVTANTYDPKKSSIAFSD